MNASGLFKLNFQDLGKGLVMAVIAALLSYFSNPSLDLKAIDWNYIFHVALTSGLAYLGKNLISDQNGAVLGKFGGSKA